MKLNAKGQCPPCKRKPLVYKTTQIYFCFKCDRAYDLDTKEQVENFHWLKTKSGYVNRIQLLRR